VAKWKKRSSPSDLPTGPRDPRSTVLSVDDEAIVYYGCRSGYYGGRGFGDGLGLIVLVLIVFMLFGGGFTISSTTDGAAS
jgi:hypothetical protein